VGRSNTSGIGQSVGQDETTLGIRIDYFDRFPGQRFHDVARSLCPSPRHVLDQRHDRYAIHLCFKKSQGPHGGHCGGAAGHVVLHFLHALGGFQAYAACIECHAFSDERQRLR
jgi:hypothetical protein